MKPLTIAINAVAPKSRPDAQQWFAERMGVSRRTVVNWVVGKPMRPNDALRAAAVLGISREKLRTLMKDENHDNA